MGNPLPNIGDSVIHRSTNEGGKVAGYGHRLVDGVYETTLRVQISADTFNTRFHIKEDLASQWKLAPELGNPKPV